MRAVSAAAGGIQSKGPGATVCTPPCLCTQEPAPKSALISFPTDNKAPAPSGWRGAEEPKASRLVDPPKWAGPEKERPYDNNGVARPRGWGREEEKEPAFRPQGGDRCAGPHLLPQRTAAWLHVVHLAPDAMLQVARPGGGTALEWAGGAAGR